MRFKLSTTTSFPDKKYAKKLMKLGFKIEANPLYISGNQELFIEINTLEELMDFVKKWGKCVIYDDEIEIYDSYRE